MLLFAQKEDNLKIWMDSTNKLPYHSKAHRAPALRFTLALAKHCLEGAILCLFSLGAHSSLQTQLPFASPELY